MQGRIERACQVALPVVGVVEDATQRSDRYRFVRNFGLWRCRASSNRMRIRQVCFRFCQRCELMVVTSKGRELREAGARTLRRNLRTPADR